MDRNFFNGDSRGNVRPGSDKKLFDVVDDGARKTCTPVVFFLFRDLVYSDSMILVVLLGNLWRMRRNRICGESHLLKTS